MELKPLHRLAMSHWVGYQVDIHGTVFELDGVGFFNERGVKAFVAGYRQAEKGAYFLETKHEVLNCVQGVALIGVHQANGQG